MSQGKNDSTMHFCRATYWTQDHLINYVLKEGHRKFLQGKTSDTYPKYTEVTFLILPMGGVE